MYGRRRGQETEEFTPQPDQEKTRPGVRRAPDLRTVCVGERRHNSKRGRNGSLRSGKVSLSQNIESRTGTDGRVDDGPRSRKEVSFWRSFGLDGGGGRG